MSKIKSRKPWRLVQKIFYYTIPPVILVYIFMKIDLNSFFNSLRNLDLRYYLLALTIYPIIICVGAYRWYYLKRKMIHGGIPLTFSMTNYWIGRTIGFLAPGSIGWDVYRIVSATGKYGNLVRNTFVAVIEKFLGLAVASLIIIVSFPFLDISSNEVINRIMVFAYIIFFSLVVLVTVGSLFSKRFGFVSRIASNVQRSLLDKLKNTRFKISQYLEKETGEEQEIKYNFRKFIPSIPFSLFLSIIIHLTGSFAVYLIIRSLNYDLPYYVPLFVAPVLTFIFLLPISFGSLGIREGAYIFFYGIFGMDQEAALLLSFLTLSGALFTVIIGGIVMQVSSVKRIME